MARKLHVDSIYLLYHIELITQGTIYYSLYYVIILKLYDFCVRLGYNSRVQCPTGSNHRKSLKTVMDCGLGLRYCCNV